MSQLEGPTSTTTTTTTTYTPTLPVTSAEYVTVVIQNTSNETSLPTTNKPNTFLVFPQRVTDNTFLQNTTATITESITTPEEKEKQTSTEPYTTSIATTIISTVRESATEITRIPLRAYREYIKKHNQTETSRNDLQQNVIEAAKRRKNTRYTSTEEPKTTSEGTTTRRSFLSRKRIHYSPPSLTEITKSVASAEHTTPNSKSFFRRHRNGTSTTAAAEPAVTDINFTEEDSLPRQANHPEHTIPKYRQGKFKPKHLITTSSPNELTTDIRSLFRYHRRQSTTTEGLPDSTTSTPGSLSGRSTIRHFLRNRKTFFGEQTTTEHEPKSTQASRSRFANGRGYGRKTTTHENASQSSENNRFTRDPIESTITTLIFQNTDQVPQSDSNEQVTGKTSTTTTTTTSTIQPTSTTISISPVILPQHSKVKTEYYEVTDILNTKNDETTTIVPFIRGTSRGTKLPQQTLGVLGQHLRIHPRNNSRFLKLHETFENRRDSYVHDYPTFRYESTPVPFQLDSTPVKVTQGVNESKIEFDVQIRHENDFHNSQRTKLKVSEGPSTLLGAGRSQSSRGRYRFFDRTTVEAKPTPSYSRQAEESSRNRPVTTDYRQARIYFKPTEESTRNSETFDNRRRSQMHFYFNPSSTEESVATTRHPPTRNRGSIKARNSLSRAEIKELVNLVEEPASKNDQQKGHKHSRPINTIEETSFVGYDNAAANTIQSPFTGRGHLAERSFLATNDFEKLNSIVDIQEQGQDKMTDLADYFYTSNGLITEIPQAATLTKDFFRVSETNNRNDENYDILQQRRLDGARGQTSKEETNEDSTEV